MRLFASDGALVDETHAAPIGAAEGPPSVITSDDGTAVAVASFDRLPDDAPGTDTMRVVVVRADCDL